MAEHDHEMPTAGLLLDALRVYQSGNQHNADLIIAPWTCCPRGLTYLLAAHFQLARQIGEYAATTLVLRFTDTSFAADVPEDARATWTEAYAVGESCLAGDHDAAPKMARFLALNPDEHGPMLLQVAVQSLAHLLDAPVRLARTGETLADGR